MINSISAIDLSDLLGSRTDSVRRQTRQRSKISDMVFELLCEDEEIQLEGYKSYTSVEFTEGHHMVVEGEDFDGLRKRTEFYVGCADPNCEDEPTDKDNVSEYLQDIVYKVMKNRAAAIRIKKQEGLVETRDLLTKALDELRMRFCSLASAYIGRNYEVLELVTGGSPKPYNYPKVVRLVEVTNTTFPYEYRAIQMDVDGSMDTVTLSLIELGNEQ